MIVVSNTSPLTNLAAIGQFQLLSILYGNLKISEGVWSELNHSGKQYPGSREVAAATWISRHRVKNQTLVTALRRDLDQGEAESIALAVELKADLILLDEKEGRHIAQRFGLSMVGVVGILLEAHLRGDLTQLESHLDALRHQAGFYISQSLYKTALQRAQEHHSP